MALVTVQRSPSPSASAETEEQDVLDTTDSNLKSPRQRSFSESYFTVKGAALILPQSDETAYTRKVTKSHAGDDIQSHLQAMFSVLRPQDTIKVAVKLEGTHTRYLVVVSCIGRQDTEESVILGMDLLEKATVGLILPVWSHMHIQLDGDGGFSIQSDKNIHIFKPVSVQAMWSALQSLNKVVKIAKDRLYIPRGLTHTWVGYYEAKLTSEHVLVSEWNATADIDRSYRSDKNVPVDISGEEDIYKRIRLELKNVMMTVDLEEVTCLFLRRSIEEKLGMDLKKYKSFIDTEMMEILGQMDSPSKILEHLYLGSEWNASNLEELQQNGVHHILNISREIDNFYPGVLHYMNVREWDVDQSDLMKYWEDTHRYINKARRRGSKALVHCKMGISRSASTVIAYLMKENKWSLQEAFDHTKTRRSIINPNPGFMKQLETYEGILNANWNRDIFNRYAPAKPMSPTEESEEGMEAVPSYPNPEDFLAMKMGKSLSDPGEIPFIHVEPDIEIASRSADSTEDSLPDQLSPEAADKSGKKKFKYSKSEGDQAESGDYISASSTESIYTSSDELSSDDEAEDDDNDDNKINVNDRESKVFVPINIPDVHTDTVQERKKAVKVEGRRCKSESDKNLLNIDEKFTREGSISKFKPDGSWIKPASESETENNEKGEGEGEGDAEMKDDAEQTDSGGLWMDAKPDSEIKDNTEDKMDISTVENDRTEAGPVQNESGSTENKGTVEQNISDPVMREDIPWNQGMVQKQKKDIEDKYGVQISKNRDSIESSEEKQQKISSENPEEMEEKEMTVEQTSQATEEDAESLSGVKSEESSPLTDHSVKIEVDRGSESPKSSPEMRRSVYEEEEIDLPEGIVRKTTMEIEERNRSTLDIPGKNLKRSSSLKSTRVTPKAKDRDNERRKTCIALLSPTHPDYTEREQNDLFYLSSNAESTSTESDQDQADAAFNQPPDDTEENSQTGSVKVYKFMGEELTVQEGLVRKQTMDIESKSQEPLTKQQIKSDAGLFLQEYCSNPMDTSTDSKQTSPVVDSNLKHCEKLSTDQTKNKKTENDSDIPSEKLIKSDMQGVSNKQNDENIAQKGRFGSSMFTPVKKQSRIESRFDSETLELIREIGSALLNSPAKSELEENENEDLKEGESLVSHYVKKIERTSGVAKRKPRKEIIIIDKIDAEGDKKSHLGGLSGKSTMTESPVDSENKAVSSKWSPVAKKQSITSLCSKEKEEQTSPQNKSANPKWSPVSRKDLSTSAIEKLSSPDFTASDKTNKIATQSEESHIQKQDLTLKLKSVASVEKDSEKSKETEKEESEVCSVKKLLGKFEQPEQASGKVTPVFGSPSILSPSSNTQFFPGAKSDSSNSNFLSSPSASSTHSPGSEVKGQGHLFSRSKSPLLHRQSEPAIHLSEKSMMIFESKLNETGSSLYDKSPVKEESDTDEFKAEKDQNESKVVRPKSASYGPAAGRRVNLRQCQTLPESETGEPGFTWEGKKVRKLYGKTHPLAKLEGRKYRDSARNSPFYNTM